MKKKQQGGMHQRKGETEEKRNQRVDEWGELEGNDRAHAKMITNRGRIKGGGQPISKTTQKSVCCNIQKGDTGS